MDGTTIDFGGSSPKKDYAYNGRSVQEKNGSLSFYLVEKDEDTPFVFAAVCYIPPKKESSEFSAYLGYALANGLVPSDQEYEMLNTLMQLKEKTQFIASLIESGEILHPLQLNSGDAFKILTEISTCSSLGIKCHIPNWWKNHTNCSVVLNIGGVESNLGRFDILTKKPTLQFNNESISEEYLTHILQMSNGLVFLKGKWIEADPKKIESVLKLYYMLKDKHNSETLIQSLRAMSLNDPLLKLNGVSNKDWIAGFEKSIESVKEQKIETEEIEQLRPYQSKGVNWISYMSKMDLGVLLADDMGLGKTLQTLAFLKINHRKGDHSLIIAPASLLTNWVAECNKFTPELSITIVRSKVFTEPHSDIVVTNYEMVSKISGFKDTNWDTIIIDEAQAIKNPLAIKSTSVKELKSRFKIALTGTPVENRLLDLWSIFDFILPGYLGTEYEFDKFIQVMKRDYRSFDPLKQMISPFLLRRLKTDKTIINDLPEKIEVEEHVKLTELQVKLYNQEYEKFARALYSKKKPLVLPILTKFKQICNHPDQYLGLSSYRPEYSGKFEYLRDLCDTIFQNNEKVLVFTQYKALIDPLKSFLKSEFGVSGLTIDGTTNPTDRKDIVDRFNEPDGEYHFMILSIRAAGVGLNLVSASHVIHFDRWWNPAVENQATDRAYRIGQKRNVIVHKMICDDTLEEKIDQMIRSKLLLSEAVITSNDTTLESMFQKMEPKELLNMVKLSSY